MMYRNTSWNPDNDGDDANNNSVQLNSTLYFNVLIQQLQEPITESAQEENPRKYICEVNAVKHSSRLHSTE
jgi:hypothetical protein